MGHFIDPRNVWATWAEYEKAPYKEILRYSDQELDDMPRNMKAAFAKGIVTIKWLVEKHAFHLESGRIIIDDHFPSDLGIVIAREYQEELISELLKRASIGEGLDHNEQ